MKEEVKRTVDDAADWAENQPLPDPSTVLHHLYGNSHATSAKGIYRTGTFRK